MAKTKYYLTLASFVVAAMFTTRAQAEPTSPYMTIGSIRPYAGVDIVYIYSTAPAGTFCSSSNYTIDISTNGGRAMYASALAALLAGRQVALELGPTGCLGGPSGTSLLQSIRVQ